MNESLYGFFVYTSMGINLVIKYIRFINGADTFTYKITLKTNCFLPLEMTVITLTFSRNAQNMK